MLRKRFFQAIFGMLLGISAMSCGERPTGSEVSGNIRVRIPWKTESGEVSVQDVELKGIQNLQQMKGKFATFYFAPKISADSLDGSSPTAQFSKNRSGVYMPLDELSQQMAVLYAHMQALHELDQKAGVEKILRWPRKISVNTRIREKDGRLWENNIFYDGGTDAILAVPYTDKKWPLAINPGVIAHEHFHALFFHQVVKNLLREGLIKESLDRENESTRRALQDPPVSEDKLHARSPRMDSLAVPMAVYNTVFLKALNEGLADVWGWIYSGQSDFVAKSFSAKGKGGGRNLKTSHLPELLTPEEDFVNIAEHCTSCLQSNLVYQAGSNLARAVRAIFIGEADDVSEQGQVLREKLARRMMKALPLMLDEFRMADGDSKMNLNKALSAILKAEELDETEQAVANQWINAAELSPLEIQAEASADEETGGSL